MTGKSEIRGWKKRYIYATLFFTGAAVMVLELMGTRIIGPYYGVSLYVWSSLIAVAMIALSLGYWAGGRLADSRAEGASGEKQLALFYRLILAAGVSAMPIPLMSSAVLKATTPLGIKMGALASAFILFAVPLALLGMATPYAIRVLADRLKVVGATAGNMFAVSTMGSVAGTIMTGFVMIPNMGTRKIIYAQAGILVGLWLVWELSSRKYAALALALPILGACIIGAAVSAALPEAGGFKVVERLESFYGTLQVIDKGRLRWLTVNNTGNTAIIKDSGLSQFPYAYYMELVNYIRPGGSDALVIGMGGGSITQRFVREYGLKVDSVEINPAMVGLAKSHFGMLASDGDVFIEDGRTYINRTDKKYDYIIFDAFGTDSPPFHLLTMETFTEARRILKPGGIIAVNVHGFRSGEGALIPASVHRTLGKAFGSVRAFHTYPTNEFGNAIMLASDAPLELAKPVEGCKLFWVCNLMNEMLAKEIKDFGVSGAVLTDDFNPIEAWSAANSELIRKDIYGFFPEEVLTI